MPSPFPGMDPFIEFQVPHEFHTAYINDIADALVPCVKPKYVVRREHRVYVESDTDDPEHREAFLTVRDFTTTEVVTEIELLTATNKRPGSTCRTMYLLKRRAVLDSGSHLVEIDLLRGGRRLPTGEAAPQGDYFAFVSRTGNRPRAEVFSWTLREPLPTIPVPLKSDDADVPLSLHGIFTTRYDRSGYDYSLDYAVAQEPPFREEDAEWVQQCLAARNR